MAPARRVGVVEANPVGVETQPVALRRQTRIHGDGRRATDGSEAAQEVQPPGRRQQ
jgi:hypothetical protein